MLLIATSRTLGSLLEEGFFLRGMSETFSLTSKLKSDSSSDSEGSGAFLFLEIGVLFGLEILPTDFTLPFPLEVPAFLSFFRVFSSLTFRLRVLIHIFSSLLFGGALNII